MKSLNLQIRSYKEKLGQIRKLQAMHKEDMVKMNQLTRKMTDLKRKKVDLQRKMTEENKQYARWKAESGKTIKQLRKIQREKNIQLQRHKTQLNKTTSALKQKTAALCNLKRRQKEMERKQNSNHRRQYGGNRRNVRRQNQKSNVKQIKAKIGKLLRSLVVKHQLFHKYKSYDRELKALQHEVREYEVALKEVNALLRQLGRHQDGNQDDDDDDEVERTRLSADKLEYEQRIEDTKSTLEYIKQKMIQMSYKMKEMDRERWQKLIQDDKVSFNCTQEDLNQFITINNTQYARSCLSFMITQQLHYRLFVDDYKREIKCLKEEKDKIVANATNEMRKQKVLIEKLQNQNQLQHQQYRTEQMLSAEQTIDDHEEEEAQSAHSQTHSEHALEHMDDGHDTDNDTMMAMDETDNDEDPDHDHSDGMSRNSPQRYATPVPLDPGLKPPDFANLDRQQISDELDQSKKLLNLYRSPMHRSRTSQLASTDVVPFAFPKMDNLSAKPRASSTSGSVNKFNTPFKRPSQVLPNVEESRVSVQLTPFHTPSVKSKTRAFTSAGNTHSTYNSLLHKPAGNGQHSMRSVSTSPLGGAPRPHNNHNNNEVQRPSSVHSNANAMSISETAPDLAPINEQQYPMSGVASGNRTQNVWSRLTNPRHYVSTSRTRAQELGVLKVESVCSRCFDLCQLSKCAFSFRKKCGAKRNRTIKSNRKRRSGKSTKMFILRISRHTLRW